MFQEKMRVIFYFDGTKISEKYTSIIPRENERIVLNGKGYVVETVVWFDKIVEIYCTKLSPKINT